MIWYGLANKTLQKPDSNKYRLVCTHASLAELAFTPNILTNLPLVQKAITAIFENEPKLILQDPLQFFRNNNDDITPEPFKVEEDLIFRFLKMIYQCKDLDELRHYKDFKDLLSIVEIRKVNKMESVDFYNKLNGISKEIKGTLKRFFTKEINQSKFRKKFIFKLNQTSNRQYSSKDINWNFLEFYENMSMGHDRNMILSQQKQDENDEIDLGIMMYVMPTNKYWTLEKRWLQLCKQIKLEKYLYLN